MPTIPWRTTVTPDPTSDYVVLASRLPLRSLTRVPGFMRLTVSVVRQLERTDGLVGYSLRAQPLAKTFWTLSAWRDREALSAFVGEMPHRAAMGHLRPHMGATRFISWTVRGDGLPVSWDEAITRLSGAEAAAPRRP